MMETQLDPQEMQTRLSFMEIDDHTAQALQEAWPVIDDALETILDGFYTRIMATPETAKILGKPERVPGLKNSQREHWRAIFSGKFDSEFAARVKTIGITHAKIGLSPQWYVGGYAYAFKEMQKCLIRAFANDPERLSAILEAATQAIMLDMELAISVYIEREEETRKADLVKLADKLEEEVQTAVEMVVGKSGEITQVSESISDILNTVDKRSSAMNEASQMTNDTIKTVASAAQSLSVAEQQIKEEVRKCSEVADQAVQETNVADERIQDLSRVGQQISDVAKLISEIAGQTNLLALNATIEAARAGEAGKGFAVVANEVKALATQTSKATGEIANNIAAIQAATDEVSQAITRIGSTINRVEETSSAIADAVEQQSAATHEITVSAQQGAQGTQQVAEGIDDVAGEISQTTGLVQTLFSNSAEMSDDIRNLHETVQDIMVTLRAHEVFDRREHRRHRINMPGTLTTANGDSFKADVIDISEGGFSFGRNIDIPSGSIVSLSMSRFSTELKARFVRNSEDRAHFAFALGADAKRELKNYIQDLLAQDAMVA